MWSLLQEPFRELPLFVNSSLTADYRPGLLPRAPDHTAPSEAPWRPCTINRERPSLHVHSSCSIPGCTTDQLPAIFFPCIATLVLWSPRTRKNTILPLSDAVELKLVQNKPAPRCLHFPIPQRPSVGCARPATALRSACRLPRARFRLTTVIYRDCALHPSYLFCSPFDM